MKIAVSTDGDFVSEHFGRCPNFTIYEIEDGKIISKEVLANPGHQPGFIPEFLKSKGVNCIIAGGMGMRAMEIFDRFNIKTIMGVSGTVEDTIKKLLENKLQGGESLCKPGAGKGYGVAKTVCDHPHDHEEDN